MFKERRPGVFIVNFEHISHLFLVFLVLSLNKQMLARYAFGYSFSVIGSFGQMLVYLMTDTSSMF